MTRRTRLESKLSRRKEWADSRRAKSSALLARNEPYRGDIAFNTQPGHIPERARVIRRSDQAAEHYTAALHHEDKAAGLEAQLDRSIFSDDPDAIERLEARIAELQTKADHYTAINKAWRKSKGDIESLVVSGLVSRPLADTIITTMKLCPYLKSPLDTTNLRADIRRNQARVEEIRKVQARQQAASSSPGGVKVIRHPAVDWCTVTFADKPDRSVIQALKSAGFRWGGGSWSGKTSQLPEGIEIEP